MKTITTAIRKLRDGREIPSNTNVEVTFDPSNRNHIALVGVEGVEGFEKRIKIDLFNAHKWLKGFTKPPSHARIEEWLNDGISQTITGKRVEPDGIGPDGSPSWLMVLGMI
jgi:hypothetical protein